MTATPPKGPATPPLADQARGRPASVYLSMRARSRILGQIGLGLALLALIGAVAIGVRPGPLPDNPAAEPTDPAGEAGSASRGEDSTADPAEAAELHRTLDLIRAQLAPARLNYNRPTELAVGERTTVSVGLLPLLEMDEAQADRRLGESLDQAPETLRRVTVEAAATMVATLVGDADAFRIQPLQVHPRQALQSDRPTEWHWLVRALRPGAYDLTLTLSALVHVGDAEEPLERTYRDRIRVRIDPVLTGSYLVGRYWLPGLAALLALALWAASALARRIWLRREQRVLRRALAGASPQGGEDHVFLSYSRRDQRFAVALARDLMERGVRVWIDQREIRAGENWVSDIQGGIARSDAMVVVLSPSAAASPFVRQEIEYAASVGKTLFPVLCRRCKPPPPLTEIHAIDFTRDYATALDRLVGDIAAKGFRRLPGERVAGAEPSQTRQGPASGQDHEE